MIEKTFGTQLRDHAIRISQERYEARREAVGEGFRPASNDSASAKRRSPTDLHA
jgi:hypothetical protein